MFSFIGRTLFSSRPLLNRNLSTHYQFWWRGKWMRVAWEMSSHSNYTHCTIGNHFLGGNTTTITMYCPISKQKSSFKYLCSYVSYEMILVWRAKWMYCCYLWRKKMLNMVCYNNGTSHPLSFPISCLIQKHFIFNWMNCWSHGINFDTLYSYLAPYARFT